MKVSDINAALFEMRMKAGSPDRLVMRWNARWTDASIAKAHETTDDLVAGWWGESGLTLNLGGMLVRIPFVVGEPVYDKDGSLKKWGLEQLGPGVWDIAPSYIQPDRFHAYIVLTGVPDIPPWIPRAKIDQTGAAFKDPGTRCSRCEKLVVWKVVTDAAGNERITNTRCPDHAD